jgi:hypothetical protein
MILIQFLKKIANNNLKPNKNQILRSIWKAEELIALKKIKVMMGVMEIS